VGLETARSSRVEFAAYEYREIGCDVSADQQPDLLNVIANDEPLK
jgi:hypothetical protein